MEENCPDAGIFGPGIGFNIEAAIAVGVGAGNAAGNTLFLEGAAQLNYKLARTTIAGSNGRNDMEDVQ
jgi:hypothetical protein